MMLNALTCMSERWEVTSATQITHSGAATTGTPATQAADHIGGSARVIPGLAVTDSSVTPELRTRRGMAGLELAVERGARPHAV